MWAALRRSESGASSTSSGEREYLTDVLTRIVNGGIQTATSTSYCPGPTALKPSKPWPENDALMSVVKAQNAEVRPIVDRLLMLDDRAWVEAEPKDVGDQALMRGLATAFPIVRPRSAPILLRASVLLPATKRLTGIPSTVVPPPPMRDDESA